MNIEKYWKIRENIDNLNDISKDISDFSKVFIIG